MPNKRYLSGRRAEYRLKAELTAHGYYVIRAAGSKGAFDLVAVHPLKLEPTRLIQVKSAKRQGNLALMDRFIDNPPLPPSPKYRQEIWIWCGRQWWNRGI